jgi:pilus assembly protein FimV
MRGPVLVGRPLELTVPVSLEGTDPDSPCAEADVFVGEQKLARAPTVRFEPGAKGQGVLRIQSPVPIDEPMITVYLRVGCGQSVTRRYVMLSELPPDNEMAAAAAPAVTTRQPVPPAAARSPVVAQAAPAAADAARAEVPSVVRRPPATAPATATAAATATATATATVPAMARSSPNSPRIAGAAAASGPVPQKPASDARAQLRVDLLDLAAERDPTLRLSSELSLQPGTDPQARLNAAAMWAALQRTPDEVLRDGQRMQALERDLGALRAQTQQNAASVSQMRSQVDQARNNRNQASWLAIALLVALAALAGWLFWQWRRARRLENVNRWFESPREPALAKFPAGAPVGPAEAATPDTHPDSGSGQLSHAAASAIAKATPSGWGTLANAEFQASAGGTVRMVGVQELIDVHDKADFFLALGQTDQAIEVLEAHIHDQVETSALAWMDLLELYYKFGKRNDFERLRAEFRQRFAVQVPDFDHFDQPTSSLENYGRALSRIVALWPSQRVLNVIEESIFRKPGLPGAEPFSLEAYRELVLLYHIAKEVAPAEDSISAPLEYKATDFPSTSLQPLNVLDMPDRPSRRGPLSPAATPGPMPDFVPEATVVMGRHGPDDDSDATVPPEDRSKLMIPPSSPRIGLDIDLDTPKVDEAADAGVELQPLDFDTSAFNEGDTEDPAHKA